MDISDEQRVALGLPPSTLKGWWYWLRYWSPAAFWWTRVRTLKEPIRLGVGVLFVTSMFLLMCAVVIFVISAIVAWIGN